MNEPISVTRCDQCFLIKRGCDAGLESCPLCRGKFIQKTITFQVDRDVCIPCKIFTSCSGGYNGNKCKNGHPYTSMKLSEAISMAEQVLAEKSAVDILAKKLKDFKEYFELSEKDLVNNDTIVRMKTALSYASILDHFPESSEYKSKQDNMHTFQKNIRKLELVAKIWDLMKDKSYAELEKMFPLVHMIKKEIDEEKKENEPMETCSSFKSLDIDLTGDSRMCLYPLQYSSHLVTVTSKQSGKVCAWFQIEKDTNASDGIITKKMNQTELDLVWPRYLPMSIKRTSKEHCSASYHITMELVSSLEEDFCKNNAEMQKSVKGVKNDTVDETVDEEDESDIVLLTMTEAKDTNEEKEYPVLEARQKLTFTH
jgi:hypothetical protein